MADGHQAGGFRWEVKCVGDRFRCGSAENAFGGGIAALEPDPSKLLLSPGGRGSVRRRHRISRARCSPLDHHRHPGIGCRDDGGTTGACRPHRGIRASAAALLAGWLRAGKGLQFRVIVGEGVNRPGWQAVRR